MQHIGSTLHCICKVPGIEDAPFDELEFSVPHDRGQILNSAHREVIKGNNGVSRGDEHLAYV